MNKTLKSSLSAIAIAGIGVTGLGSIAAASYGDEPEPADEIVVDETDDSSDDASTDDSSDDDATSVDDASDDASEDGDAVGLQAATDDTEAADDDGRRNRCGDGVRNSDAVAEALGLTTEELQAARDAGQSLAEIAADQGVSTDAVVDAIVDGIEEHLAEEVVEGDLTQEEADERLAAAEERAAEKVEAAPGEDGQQGFGGGRRRGDAPATTDA